MSILVSVFSFLLLVCISAGWYLGGPESALAGAWWGVAVALALTVGVLAVAVLLAWWHDRNIVHPEDVPESQIGGD